MNTRLKLTLCSVVLWAGLSHGAVPVLSDRAARKSPDWIRDGVMYQIQWTAFTKEGTIAAAAKRLPWLSHLGVTVVYVVPVFRIDTDPDPAGWSQRQKASGFNNPKNPYRTMDYFAIDSQYGTEADYVEFVRTAHALGLRVIQDIVFVHAGPNLLFAKDNPQIFKHDRDGRIVLTKYNFAKLDFSAEVTRQYCTDVLEHWVRRAGIDGYRCDLANQAPLDFWIKARQRLEAVRSDIVMLAEAWKPQNLLEAFDVNYNFPVCLCHLRTVLSGQENSQFNEWFMNGVDTNAFKGAARIRRAAEIYAHQLPAGGLTMNFTENHDTSADDFENRAEKRLGTANQELGLATVFALEGLPLIYNGQEIADANRHSFFGPLGVDWSRADDEVARRRLAALRRLIDLRRSSKAFRRGKAIWLDTDQPEKILALVRRLPGESDVFFVGNFTGESVTAKIKDHPYGVLTLRPWGYSIVRNGDHVK